MTFASITLRRLSVELMGYAMEDGTFQFVIKGKMQTFPSLMAVWEAYTA